MSITQFFIIISIPILFILVRYILLIFTLLLYYKKENKPRKSFYLIKKEDYTYNDNIRIIKKSIEYKFARKLLRLHKNHIIYNLKMNESISFVVDSEITYHEGFLKESFMMLIENINVEITKTLKDNLCIFTTYTYNIRIKNNQQSS